MSDVVINSFSLEQWKGPTSDVELRLTLDIPIVTPELEAFGTSSDFVARAQCTIASAVIAGITQYTLTIPQITIPATGNALVGRTARYMAGFYKANGQLIQPWSGFESFNLSATPSPTDWATIRIANEGAVLPFGDMTTFSRSEILSLLGPYLRKLSGYAAPTGTEDRTTFATYTAPTISNPPTRAEVQAIADHVEILSQHIAALINDVKE